jgi:hypothetical protein
MDCRCLLMLAVLVLAEGRVCAEPEKPFRGKTFSECAGGFAH